MTQKFNIDGELPTIEVLLCEIAHFDLSLLVWELCKQHKELFDSCKTGYYGFKMLPYVGKRHKLRFEVMIDVDPDESNAGWIVLGKGD